MSTLNVIDSECANAYTISAGVANLSSVGPSPQWDSTNTYSQGNVVYRLSNGHWTQYTSLVNANFNVTPGSNSAVWEPGCYCDESAYNVTLECPTTTTSTTTTTDPTTTDSPTTTPPPPGGKGDPHITPFFGKEYTI